MDFQKAKALAENDDPKLYERFNSYQWNLSQDILARRIQLGLTRKQAAKVARVGLKRFTAFERGTDMESSQEDYQEVLDKLKEFNSRKEKEENGR